jgi:Holliday junction resolvase RusA-like endonuclease
MISFHLPIVPPKATSQTKRLVMIGGKPQFFPKKEHAEAERNLLSLCAAYAPNAPLSGPLKLQVDFVFPWRKCETKRRRSWLKLPNDKRPDCDNLVKLVADVLTKLRFYGDDGQVSTLIVSKSWGDRVGISVGIESIQTF